MLTLYEITGPSGKRYIGITKRSLAVRLKAHSIARRGYLPFAVRLHGIENFSIRPLVVGPRDYIMRLEAAAIVKFKTRFPKGYNLTAGGEHPAMHSASREKLRRSQLSVQEDPEYMERKRETTRDQWDDPDTRQSLTDGINKAWQDPGRKERHRLAMIEHWKKRRAKW